MTDSSELTHFRIRIPDDDLTDLRDRLERARWPHAVPGRDDRTDFTRGIPQAYLSGLVAYWQDVFDWRAHEAKFNAYNQVTTEIDGQTLHVVHVRSPRPLATPLLLCHGWPGSFIEYVRLIPLLAEHFHLVIPSLPGFGFSTPLSGKGWEVGRSTDAYAQIMTRLGYDRFGVHGTDIGAGIAGRLASLHPERVIGVHTASDRRALGFVGVQFPAPPELGPDDLAALDEIRAETADGNGYAEIQSHTPDTIGPALTDSPVAQLAWIAEKFQRWTGPGNTTPEQAVDLDQLLANVALYWFTRSGASSAQFYYEASHSGLGWLADSDVPAGLSFFDAHPVAAKALNPRGEFTFWAEHDRGGHFPAMETPELLAADLLAFFRTLT